MYIDQQQQTSDINMSNANNSTKMVQTEFFDIFKMASLSFHSNSIKIKSSNKQPNPQRRNWHFQISTSDLHPPSLHSHLFRPFHNRISFKTKVRFIFFRFTFFVFFFQWRNLSLTNFSSIFVFNSINLTFFVLFS